MASNIALVERLNKAAETKDFDTVKSLLHPDYTLKDPMMEFHSAKEALEFMKDCPFECKLENVEFVAESGDKVVQTLDAVMVAPVSFRFRMCDILTIEDGKVCSEEVFYDTAQIPPEARQIGEKAMKAKAA